MFTLFAFSHQPRPEVFWRHSPLTFYYISIFTTSIQYSIQFRGLNWIVNSLRMSKLNWIELNWAQFKVNCLNYCEPWLFLVRKWLFWVLFSHLFDYFTFRWICSMVFPAISAFKGRMWVYIILNFTDIAFIRFCRVFFDVNLVLVIWSVFPG